MDRSEALELKAQQRLAKLDRYFDGVVGCRIAFEARHRHHRQGTIFHVTINLALPGVDVVVTSRAEENHAHEDPFVALRDAFDAAGRQLESRVGRMRGESCRGRAPVAGQERGEEAGEIVEGKKISL